MNFLIPNKIIKLLNLSIILFLLINVKLFAENHKQHIIKDLNEDWLAYNPKYSTYLPILSNNINNYKIVHQWINPNQYLNHKYAFYIPSGVNIFINNKLFLNNISDKDTQRIILSKELVEKFGNKIFLSVYAPKRNLLGLKIQIFEKEITSKVENIIRIKTSVLQPKIRNKSSNNNNYSITVFLMLIAIVAVIKYSNSDLLEGILGYKNLLINNSNEEVQLNKIWNIDSLLLICVISIILAYLYNFVNLFHLNTVATSHQIFTFDNSLEVVSTIKLSLVFMVAFLLRLLFLIIFGWFFKLGQLVKMIYFNNLKFLFKALMIVFILAFIITTINLISSRLFSEYLIGYIVIILLVLLIKNLYISIKYSSSRNVYLFSYLCISEIFPTIFMVTFLFR
ncbi:MAG: DUF4271 domain-containing protein [Cytophagales bacterium]|nr:MAG: DUF4271 domain-containing protein [Cytophagales bacterium]